ncbi:MAG: hypothetical protein V7604_28 [Hyphomicrobiales bacterium]|jgi:hypothetical protein
MLHAVARQAAEADLFYDIGEASNRARMSLGRASISASTAAFRVPTVQRMSYNIAKKR